VPIGKFSEFSSGSSPFAIFSPNATNHTHTVGNNMRKNLTMKKICILILFYCFFSCDSNSSDEETTDDGQTEFICDSTTDLETNELFYINGEQELLDFRNQGFTHINFALQITNVESLEPLSCLKSVHHLLLTGNNISNLNGLENLITLDRLTITNCDNLINFEGIGNVSTIDELEVRYNENLIDFEGFESLTSIASLNIRNNDNLINFNGLENIITNLILDETITGINSTFVIYDNQSLLNLNGLHNISSDINSIILGNCASLTSFGNFTQLNNVGVFSINNCDSLTSINGFDNLEDIFTLQIEGNDLLENFNFPSLLRVGYLNIGYNINLNSLEGLNSLNEVYSASGDFSLDIDNNDSLLSLSGLNNLNFTEKKVSINQSYLSFENPLETACALRNLYLNQISDGVSDNQISFKTNCWGNAGFPYSNINEFDLICDCN
jgi:hypothetical protein